MYGGGLGQEETEKKEMEHTLTFSMLGVRVAELKGAWLENQHDLEAALIQVNFLMILSSFYLILWLSPSSYNMVLILS